MLSHALPEREKAIATQKQESPRLKDEIGHNDQHRTQLNQSWYWKLARLFSRLRKKIVPNGSHLEHIYRWVSWPLRTSLLYGMSNMLALSLTRFAQTALGRWLSKLIMSLLPRTTREFIDQFRWELRLPDHSHVILFADEDILPGYEPRRRLELPSETYPVKVTLISTVYNEASTVESWLNSLLHQRRLPDEVVITDGGSTDGTPALIRRAAENFPIPIQLIETPGANISRGRNIAIQHASHQLIASTDCGSILSEEWLYNLILPFEVDPRIEVSCGFSQPVQGNEFERRAACYLIPTLDVVKPQQYLPSSRSIAFRKQVWKRVDGYPEWLSLAGEDTLFDLYAKLHEAWWSFVPQAVAYWHAPNNLSMLYRTQYRYAKGDGESGLFASNYWEKALTIIWQVLLMSLSLITILGLAALCLWLGQPWIAAILTGIVLVLGLIWLLLKLHRNDFNFKYMLMPVLVHWAQLRGYSAGVKERPKIVACRAEGYAAQLRIILEAHPNRKGVIVYPPTHDWGYMFQLPQQMARVFARRDYLYFYCTNNEITDDVIGFRLVEPNLYLTYVPLETFSELPELILYIGSPWHQSVIKLFNQPTVIYDYYDDLKVSSGRVEDFDALVEEADVVIVTAERLLENVKAKRPDAVFVPNGVDVPYIISQRPDPEKPMPEDWQAVIETGKPVIGYSGSMAERFDYDLLKYLVENRPDLEFVLIGVSYDGSLERSGILTAGYENLHWLGMKSYTDLFQYVWRFDVGIIPFKINEITQATTSIKLFEYMACEVPVVSTAMPESKRYPGVLIGDTYAQFFALLDQALILGNDPQYLATIRAVASERSWDQRAAAILERIGTRRKD